MMRKLKESGQPTKGTCYRHLEMVNRMKGMSGDGRLKESGVAHHYRRASRRFKELEWYQR